MVKSLVTAGALAHSQFRWFYLSRTISLFGSGMTPVALAFAVLQVPYGQRFLGYIMAAEILPEVLMLFIGGNVADRYRRDRLIQLGSLSSGFFQAGLAAVVLSGARPYWMFPMAVMNGIVGAFTAPAMHGILPEMVEGREINEANALLNTSRSVAKVVGPAVSGLIVGQLGGGWGIALDSLSFFVAAACMARVGISSHPAPSSDSFVQHMRTGWAYFRRSQWIWSITGAWAVMNAVQMGAWRVLGPIIAQHTFGPTGWGLTLSFQAVGLLIASILMMRFEFSHPLRDGLVAAAALGIPMVILGQGLSLPYLMGATGVAGVGSAVSGITWDTSLQKGVPKDKLSRVMAFDDFGAYLTIPFGVSLAVPVADRFGLHMVETAAGILFIVTALAPLAFRSVRQMTSTDIEVLGLGTQKPDSG